jgi:hypothetical protein
MNSLKNVIIILLVAFMIMSGSQLYSQVKSAPASIAAAMALKVVGFEKGMDKGGDITIYVLGANDVADELKKGVGKPVGKANLKEVLAGDNLPATKPTILFLGNAAKFDAAIQYTHANKVLSVTGLPELASKGISLGFGVGDDNKPKILLNLSASVEEGLDWNPAILKVAQTIK